MRLFQSNRMKFQSGNDCISKAFSTVLKDEAFLQCLWRTFQCRKCCISGTTSTPIKKMMTSPMFTEDIPVQKDYISRMASSPVKKVQGLFQSFWRKLQWKIVVLELLFGTLRKMRETISNLFLRKFQWKDRISRTWVLLITFLLDWKKTCFNVVWRRKFPELKNIAFY